VNDQKEGFGEYKYKAKEAVYEGNFKSNMKNGKGKYWYLNGDEYEGNFVNGQKEGYGKFTWNSGERYEGQWQGG
jgi:1-phosphatidylinositol-4-phosphate 5-kinase